MTDSQNSAPEDGAFLSTLEQENQKLQQEQVRRINNTMRKVRRISRDSQRFAKVTVVEEIEKRLTSTSAEESASFYVEKPNRIEHVGPNGDGREDDTGEFCIPEPSASAVVTEALDQAFHLIEQERREFRANLNSPVIKRWRII